MTDSSTTCASVVEIPHAAPQCNHEYFKCRVPAGDSCQPIYHQVCRKCRWDSTKGIVMPDKIWRDWAVPQLEKKSNMKKTQTTNNSMTPAFRVERKSTPDGQCVIEEVRTEVPTAPQKIGPRYQFDMNRILGAPTIEAAVHVFPDVWPFWLFRPHEIEHIKIDRAIRIAWSLLRRRATSLDVPALPRYDITAIEWMVTLAQIVDKTGKLPDKFDIGPSRQETGEQQ